MDEKLQKELAEVKSNLRSTVISSAVQLSLSNTMRDYRTLTGEAIPYMKFGYKSVIDFLVERCADVVELDDRSMNPVVRAKITEQNRHIASLVSKQKITPAKHKGRSLRPQSYNYNVSSQYAAPHHIRYKPARSNLTCHKPQLKQEPSKTHNQTINYDNQQYKQNQQIDSRKQIKQSQENSQFNNNERHANQNQASNQAHNHNRPQVKQTEEIVQTKIHYKDAETQSVGQVSNSLSEQDSGRHSISAYENTFEATKSNLAELLSRHPKGIERMQLLKLYSEMFNTELCYKSMGFSSLVGMCRSLEDVMHVLRPSPYSDLLLMDARLPKPSELELRRQVALAEMQQAEFSSDTSDDALPGVPYDKGIFPADCMQFQECLPARSVSELKVGSYYEVSVAEVLDPSHFWFQQLGEHYSDTMNSIMDEMTEYFTKGPGRDGSMQQGAVQVGQYCAAPFGAEGYHRSIIVKMLSKELVKVRHVDYGTVAVVQQRALRPLRRDWAKLPAQAFRGRLYRLRPANNTNWSHSAAERFLQLVYNAKLIAEIVAVDNEEQIVDIILADTSTKQDKFINDTLVHEKFGIVGEINPKILEPFLRPSFDDLENGRAMNYDTRLKLLNNNLEPELFDEYGGGRIPESTSVTQEARGKLNRTREIERLDHGERDTAHSVCKDTIVDSDPEEHYEFYGNYECQYDSKEEVDASLIDYSGSETKETILVRSDIDHTLSDLSFNKIPLELPATRSTVPLDMTALSLNEQHLPHHTGQHQVESLSINSLNNDARSQNINFVTPLSNGPYPNQNILPWTNIPVYPQSLNNVSNIPMFTNPSPPVSLFFPPQSQQVYNLACSTSNVSQQHQNTLYPMNPQAFNVANHSLNGSQHNMASNFASRDPTQPQKFVVAPGTVSQQNLPCNIVPSKHLTASHISLNDIIKPRSDNQYASSQSNIASVRPHVPNQLPHSASSSNNSTAPPNSNTSPAKSISAKTASTHQRSEPPMTPIALSFAQIDLDIFKTVSMCDPSLANQIIIKKIKTRDGEQPDPPGLDQTPTTVITLLPIEMGIFSRLADQDPTMANDMIKEKIDYHMNHQN